MINIVKARPEDALDINKILYRTWIETYPNSEVGVILEDVEELFKNRFTKEHLEIRREAIKNIKSETELILIALDTDTSTVLGFCRGVRREESNQLQSIYVLPDYQRKNIGKMLWLEIKKFFDKDKKTIVQLATYNKNALGFYTSIGFKDKGKRFEQEKHKMPISGVTIPEMEMELENA